jgi:hypothetical protein
MVSPIFSLPLEQNFLKNGHREAKNSFIIMAKLADFTPKCLKNALF